MDTLDLSPLLEQLEDNIDDLQDTLSPLLKAPLSETAAKLPLLDRAKLYVSITYAIESILFSFLRLNGTDAKQHPVFRELTRLKQYFEKIKTAEFGALPRENLSLNKSAAGRIIKHALAGNDRYDLQRAELHAKEKARAHIRFEESSKKRKVEDDDAVVKRPVVDAGASSSSSSSSSSESESEKESSSGPVEPEQATSEVLAKSSTQPKKKRNRAEKRDREATSDAASKAAEAAAETEHVEGKDVGSTKRRRIRKRTKTKTKQQRLENPEDGDVAAEG